MTAVKVTCEWESCLSKWLWSFQIGSESGNSCTHPWHRSGKTACRSASAGLQGPNRPARWCRATWNRSRFRPETTRTSPLCWIWQPVPQRSPKSPEPAAEGSGPGGLAGLSCLIGAGGRWGQRPEDRGASGHRRSAPTWWRGLRSARRRWRRSFQWQTEELCFHNLGEKRGDTSKDKAAVETLIKQNMAFSVRANGLNVQIFTRRDKENVAWEKRTKSDEEIHESKTNVKMNTECVNLCKRV